MRLLSEGYFGVRHKHTFQHLVPLYMPMHIYIDGEPVQFFMRREKTREPEKDPNRGRTSNKKKFIGCELKRPKTVLNFK